MRKYKNTSRFPKKFYGVEFPPGKTREVPGWINDPVMVLVKESAFTSSEGSGRRSGRKRQKSSKPEKVEVVEIVEDANEDATPVENEATAVEESNESDTEVAEDAPF